MQKIYLSRKGSNFQPPGLLGITAGRASQLRHERCVDEVRSVIYFIPSSHLLPSNFKLLSLDWLLGAMTLQMISYRLDARMSWQ